METKHWLLLGGAGVAAWWLFFRKKGPSECERAWETTWGNMMAARGGSIPPGIDPAQVASVAKPIFMRHCQNAPAAQRGCFTVVPGPDGAPQQRPECEAATMPMMMELMSAVMSAVMPAMMPSGDMPPPPAPLPGTAPPGLMPGEMEVVAPPTPVAPTPEAIAENTTATSGLGYTGGMFARHLFAGQK